MAAMAPLPPVPRDWAICRPDRTSSNHNRRRTQIHESLLVPTHCVVVVYPVKAVVARRVVQILPKDVVAKPAVVLGAQDVLGMPGLVRVVMLIVVFADSYRNIRGEGAKSQTLLLKTARC